MTTRMRRRDFLDVLGGAAAAPAILAPRAARAQQRAMPVVGYLDPTSIDANREQLRGFHQGLKEAGFIEGDNVAIDYRFADNRLDLLPALAAELVRRRVAAIVAASPPAVFAAKAATTTVPIIFGVGEDPVGMGLVKSLARPEGNLTGINFFTGELTAKRLELLRELVPGAVRIAAIVNPANATITQTVLRELETAAGAMRLQTQILHANTSGDIDAAFTVVARERPDALFVGSGPFLGSRRVQITQLAARVALPASYAARPYAEVGGLMSYGTSRIDSSRQMGFYVGRILKGAKAADLPVVQSTKFELVINHQTARMLGLTVPPLLLTIADEVIE